MALIRHYKLQDAAGSATVVDSSVYGDTATVGSGSLVTATGPGGEFTSAAQFNGASEYIIGSAMSNATYYPDPGIYSMTFWSQAPAYTATGVAFNLSNGGTGSTIIYSHDDDFNGPRIYIRGAVRINVASNVTDPTVWRHTALAFDGVDVHLYENGVFLGSGIQNGDTFNNSFVRIGSYTNTTQFFAGAVADCRLFNHQLTPTEITAIYDEVANPGGGGGLSIPIAMHHYRSLMQ